MKESGREGRGHDNMLMTNRYMKRYSTSLIIKEIQSKESSIETYTLPYVKLDSQWKYDAGSLNP